MSEFSKFTFSMKLGDASITLRADSIEELDELANQADAWIEKQEAKNPPGGSTTSTSGATATSKDSSGDGPPPAPVNAVQKMVDETRARQAEVDKQMAEDKAAIEKAEQHLGPGEERASDTLIKAAAAMSGKTVEELDGISKNAAVALINGKEQ